LLTMLEITSWSCKIDEMDNTVRPFFLLVGLRAFFGKSDVGGEKKKKDSYSFYIPHVPQCLCRRRNKKIIIILKF
jgi:hypothetical protein